MEKLKPCPFCGSVARISYGSNETLSFGSESWVIAMCCSCGIRTPKFYYCPEQGELSVAETMVTKRWNKRVERSEDGDIT